MNIAIKKNGQVRPRFYTNRGLALLFLPLIIEQTLKYSTGLVDSMMVASIGEAAVSGISLVDFVMSFIMSLISALLIGGSAIISQSIGRKDVVAANTGVGILVKSALIISCILALIVYGLSDFILQKVFGPLEYNVYHHARIYLLIMLTSIPFLGLYSAGANIFRCMNNTYTPMLIMFVCNVLNIIGNAICLFYFGMGTAGVAFSTLLSRIIAALWIYMILNSGKRILNVSGLFRRKFEFGLFRKIMRIGIPTGVENGTFFLGRILVLSIVASLGTYAIATNAVAGALSNFQVIPGMAIAFGTTVVIGRCKGAQDIEQAKFYNRRIITIVYVIQLFTVGVVYLLLNPILSIYSLSDETTGYVRSIMSIHSIFTIAIWPLAYILPSTFRAAGDARFPMLTGVISLFAGRLFGSWFLGVYCSMGIVGIWLGMFVDWILKSIAFIVRYYSGKWFEVSKT